MAVLTRSPDWFLGNPPPPGYRFNPTEVELILFYLKNKVLGKNLATVDCVIPEVDLSKLSPWDITEKCFKGRDQQEYFFCRHKMKFASSSRKNRSTTTGQWRTTGKDKKIPHKSATVGMKKILVFCARGSLQDERTGWVIYEYRLCNQLVGDSGAIMNGYVLCKLFKKRCSDQNEVCEDYAYGDAAFVPNSSLTGSFGSDTPCRKDTMEERFSRVPNHTDFTYDFSDIMGQEVASHLDSSSPRKTDGCQHSSYSLEEDYDIDADIGIAAHGRIPVIHMPSECRENSFDLESTLLNCPTDHINSCSRQRENTSAVMNSSPDDVNGCLDLQDNFTLKKHFRSHPPDLTPEFESHKSYKKSEVTFFRPGFRFSPTETQLLLFYLRSKVLGKKLTIVDKVMPEIDLYKVSPWDIPGKYFKSRDQQEYFFFCRHERKFTSSLRKKRSTNIGQWKISGQDKKFKNKHQSVGMRRTLIFHVKRSLQVEKTSCVTYDNTSWYIYEYSLHDSGVLQNSYVLCKLFKKSCSSPNNYKPSSVEDCEDDAYSDDIPFIPASFAGGVISDITCCSKGIMEERESCIPDKTNFTCNFPSITNQEVTSHQDYSSPHKTNGQQHSSYSLEETYEIHADIGITSNVSSFYHRSPIILLSSERKQDSFDLERTLLDCQTDDVHGCYSQLETTFPTECLSSHPSELAPELESQESSEGIFNILPSDELCPIDSQCYCTLDFD